MADRLTERQEEFIRRYLLTLNGTQSALDAGYSPRGIDSAASRLLLNPKIRQAITDAQLGMAKRAEISQDWVIEQLRINAEAARDQEKPDWAASNRAFELIGRHLGMFPVQHPNQHTTYVQQYIALAIPQATIEEANKIIEGVLISPLEDDDGSDRDTQ